MQKPFFTYSFKIEKVVLLGRVGQANVAMP